MSQQGDIISALEALWRSVVPAIRAGEYGFIRGQVISQDVDDTRVPFLMGHTPSTQETWAGAHWQRQANYTIAWELVTRGESQEQLLVWYDSLRSLIAADATLGGIVKWTHCSLQTIDESRYDEKQERVLLVETTSNKAES